jgi:hypothetical protein
MRRTSPIFYNLKGQFFTTQKPEEPLPFKQKAQKGRKPLPSFLYKNSAAIFRRAVTFSKGSLRFLLFVQRTPFFINRFQDNSIRGGKAVE